MKSASILLLLLLLCSGVCGSWVQYIKPNGTQWPLQRRGHSMDMWGKHNVVIFGGRSVEFVNETDSLEALNLYNTSVDCYELRRCYGRGICYISNSTEVVITEAVINSDDPVADSETDTGLVDIPQTTGCTCDAPYTGTYCELREAEQFMADIAVFNLANDTWTYYEPDTLDTFNPKFWAYRRYMHVSAIFDDTLVVYGGYALECVDYCYQVWEFNFNDFNGRGAWYAFDLSGPGKRWKAASVVVGDDMYVFGGMRLNTFLDDMWVLERNGTAGTENATRRWIQVSFTSMDNPEGREGMSMAVHRTLKNVTTTETVVVGTVVSTVTVTKTESTTYIYLYGGYRRPSAPSENSLYEISEWFFNDFWRFHVETGAWERIELNADDPNSVFPSSRYETVLETVGNALFMFGGYYENEYLSDIYRYNLTNKLWNEHIVHFTVENKPIHRSAHAVVYAPHYDYIMLFGGHGSDSSARNTLVEDYYDDLWRFDLNNCPGDCYGRGVCFFGYCFCQNDYFGDDCQNVRCEDDTCSYSSFTYLQECSQCSGKGTCYLGACRCDSFFGGVSCGDMECPRNCSDHGVCRMVNDLPTCDCDNPYFSHHCGLKNCPGTDSCGFPLRGRCEYSTGECECFATSSGTFSGATCLEFIAPGVSWMQIKSSVLTWQWFVWVGVWAISHWVRRWRL